MRTWQPKSIYLRVLSLSEVALLRIYTQLHTKMYTQDTLSFTIFIAAFCLRL